MIIKALARHRTKLIWVLPFISTALLSAAFLWYPLSWLALVGVVPYVGFVYCFEHQTTAISRRAFITTTWLMGLFFCLFVASWFIATDTSAWTHLGNFPLRAVVFLLWFIFGLVLSVGFWLLGEGLAWFEKRVQLNWLLVLVLPALWLLNEFIRSWLLSVVNFGHGGSLGPYWNFGNLGLAAAATPLTYAGRLVGLYGLSALVVLINVSLFWLLMRRWSWALGCIIGASLIAVLGYGLYQSSLPTTVTLATVQLPSTKVDYFDDLNQVASQHTHPVPNLLALPEYSYFFDFVTPGQITSLQSDVFRNQPGLLTYTRKDYVPGLPPFNQIVYVTTDGQTVSAQHKSFLIPTGEYLPWFLTESFRLSGKQSIITSFTGDITVSRSSVGEVPVEYRGVRYSALACSAVIAPQLYQHQVQHGAQVLINDASLNEFRDAAIYHQQARQFVRFAAVATNRPFVQAARGGFAYIVDRNGRFLYQSPRQGVQMGYATVKLSQQKTLYDYLGDWLIVVAVVVLGGLALTSISGFTKLQKKGLILKQNRHAKSQKRQ